MKLLNRKRQPMWSAERAQRRLKLGLGFFFICIGFQVCLLFLHAYDQLKFEALYNLRAEADDFIERLDSQLNQVLREEEERTFEDYRFITLAGKRKSQSKFLQLSPLSQFPPSTDLAGVIGYFQIDPNGDLTSPFLPWNANSPKSVISYGIDGPGFKKRQDRIEQIKEILRSNNIASASTNGAGEFEDNIALNKSQSKDEFAKKGGKPLPTLEYDSDPRGILGSPLLRDLKKVQKEKFQPRAKRKVQVAIPEGQLNQNASSIRTFEGEVDAFQFGMLTSGHFVLYRKVWRDNQRFIQGVLIGRDAFLRSVFEQVYRTSNLSDRADLIVGLNDIQLASYQQATIENKKGTKSSGVLLTKAALSAPFNDLQIFLTTEKLRPGASVYYLQGIGFVLGLVLLIGTCSIYLAGRRQIALAGQQRDFVSAVSHELKTPLTSIRMYSEMLREGWATPDKQRTYSDYIFNESERLSRLIANVLQLARLSRGQDPEVVDKSVNSLFQDLGAMIHQMAGSGDFVITLQPPEEVCSDLIRVDEDGIRQVFINLVDNAMKFARDSSPRQIDFGYQVKRDGKAVSFFVRDYGPGIKAPELKRIFKLFYRTESELTRSTKGTGIGLALVKELTARMGAGIDAASKPGDTVFEVTFPIVAAAHH